MTHKPSTLDLEIVTLQDRQMSTLQGGNPFYDFMKRHGFLWESASKNNHDSKDSK